MANLWGNTIDLSLLMANSRLLYLGIDFGTSGARAIVIDATGAVQSQVQCPFEETGVANLTTIWQNTLYHLIRQIPEPIRQNITRIAIDGTSGTVLLCDRQGIPITEPLLYNDGRGIAVIEQLKQIAPPNSVVLTATSSLAKLLWFIDHTTDSLETDYILHQADWLAFLLHGQMGISDYHNALKLGYDPETLNYPTWMRQLRLTPILPQVLAPGTPVGEVTREIASGLGLPQDCQVCTGTTDSIAAFLASGAQHPGEAVTSLGSTLVLKLLSHTRVEAADYGIYSHRLGNLWLTGGASNTGGAVLRQFFNDSELQEYSHQINPKWESPLDYYPLLKKGDRFPINDPELPPKLEPQPANPVDFLHGLLESMARIEARGYQLLQELSATPLTCVYTAGGGAKNPTWTAIRERQLQVTIHPPKHTEAAYGTALLMITNDP